MLELSLKLVGLGLESRQIGDQSRIAVLVKAANQLDSVGQIDGPA